jgi:D-psicose/D-tagatose/L-ribulose 3-epimerase
MKIGMNLLLWTSHVTPEHSAILAKLKQTGFDGVEVPLFEGDEAHYKSVGRELERAGLTCSTITVCSPDASPVSPATAPLGVFTGREPSEDEKQRAADVLRAGAEHAAKLNARIAVEFLCRFETYMLNTARDAAAMVKRVNHPNLGMLYDTFHANIEEKNPPAALAATAEHVIHFHISENDRGTPGDGHVQRRETFQALRKINYDGWLTIEAFSRVLPELAAATRVWRDFFPSVDDVYTRGYQFIRKSWDEAGR